MAERITAALAKTVKTYPDREQWVSLVLARADIKGGAKLCAVALAQHLNFESGQLNPAIPRLAKCTAQTDRAIEKQLQELKVAGVIEWQRAKGRSSNSYRLLLLAPNRGSGQEPASTEPPFGTKAALDPNRGSGQKLSTPNGQHRSPEPPGAYPRTVVRSNLENLENLGEPSLGGAVDGPARRLATDIKRDSATIGRLEKLAGTGETMSAEEIAELEGIIAAREPDAPLRVKAERLLGQRAA